MYLNFLDSSEVIYLTLILKAVREERPVSEVLAGFVEVNRVSDLMRKIQKFGENKLEHPILSLALENMEEFLRINYKDRIQ